MIQLVVIGHSHTTAIARALERQPSSLFSTRIIHMRVFGHQIGAAEPIEPDASGVMRIHPALYRELAQVNESDLQIIVSMIGGNAHYLAGMLQHPMPLDFILPEQPDLPIAEGATIVPYDFMHDALGRHAYPHMAQIEALRKFIPGPILHLQPPPLIGDDHYVRQHLEPYFRQHLEPQNGEQEREIAPRMVRYKFWRLHSKMIHQFCSNIGVRFVPVPEGTTDPEGFLVPEGYPGNATHANEWYGERLVQQIEDIVASMA